MAEALVGILYIAISLAPFFSNFSAFERVQEGECVSKFWAGFGSFARGCFDVGLRQQTARVLKTLVSDSPMAPLANVLPLFGLSCAIGYLAKQLALAHG
jgi:hypothetical protein